MIAGVGVVAGDVGDAGLFPEADLFAPFVRLADRGHPHLEADFVRIAAGFARQIAQSVECGNSIGPAGCSSIIQPSARRAARLIEFG